MGKRLLLRLGTTCNNGCLHCTVGDIRGTYADRTTLEIFAALEAGRKWGATEVVFLRGEPTIRTDFLRLIRRGRDLGFGTVQVQTNGRMFATPGFTRESTTAGLTHAEVSLYGPNAEIHDPIARADGAFEQTHRGLMKLAMEGVLTHINIPVVRGNREHLMATLELLEDLCVERVQLNLQRPIPGSEFPGETLSLQEAIGPIQSALEAAQSMGLTLLTEGIPLCLLHPYEQAASDRWIQAPNIRIDDLHRTTEDIQGLRDTYRHFPSLCGDCSLRQECPGTWLGPSSFDDEILLIPRDK